MNDKNNIDKVLIEKLYYKLDSEAKSSGYNLNPDVDFTKDLIKGLIINNKRYGYISCPCRLASGKKSEDIDIICPCDYRDADLDEYGCCFCALYVSSEVLKGEKDISPIPERRISKNKNNNKIQDKSMINSVPLSKPVWRCRVCGYLCGRDNPPEVCPICKAKKERFEKFI
jgi:ferredoxin-thioredoxin reductase catalytic subunit